MTSEDLFRTEIEERQSRGSEIKWRIISNHLNMMFMLAAGMVMPSGGFGKKYYQDTLSLLPGWIPLFPAQNMLKSAIDYSIEEDQILVPCYAELDLSDVSGPVKVLRAGEWSDARFPDQVFGDEELILIPAPLPVTMIREIVFRSKGDKMVCEKSARDVANVPLKRFKIKASPASFKKPGLGHWPPSVSGLQERHISMDKPDSVGGMLVALYHVSNKYDLAVDAYRAAYEGVLNEALERYPILSDINKFLNLHEQPSEQLVTSGAMFWKLAGDLIGFRKKGMYGSAVDVVLASLEQSSKDLQGHARDASNRLTDDLKTAASFAEKTLTELLELHQKPLPRALLLFTIKDDTTDFLEISNALLNEYDICAAAILFGISDGWMKLPLDLRKSGGLEQSIPFFMAGLSHQLSNSGLILGKLPDRPKSLRELFRDDNRSKKQKDAALYLARQCKWDCIRTRIKLGKGEYKLVIEGSGVNILLDGDVKAVEAEVDYEAIMNLLSSSSGINLKVEQEVRKMLGVQI